MPASPLIADLGAGGGLPGIPLAIALPDWQFVLVEAVKKKAAFLQHVKGKLGLNNLEVVGDRIEALALARPGFADATISRAFSELRNFVNFSEPLLKEGGLIFAMKSQKASEELMSLPIGWELIGNEDLHVPNLDAQRCLLTLHSVRK
jgi:16S rRNA (guanine527-N7)-methyltransferase